MKVLVRLMSLSSLVLASTVLAHEGHFTGVAWDACAHRALGDVCSFEDEVNVLHGSCRSISDALVCVRNRPLEPKGQLGARWLCLGLVGVACSVGLVRRRSRQP